VSDDRFNSMIAAIIILGITALVVLAGFIDKLVK
jgi:hypothetical protein